MSAEAQVEAFKRKLMARCNEIVRKTIIGVAESLLSKSPFGDAALWNPPGPKTYLGGTFIANWQYGQGAMPTGTLDLRDAIGGAATLSAITGQIGPNPAGQVHYLVNNVPYAQRLEHGYSKQAPAGIVGLTILELGAIARQAGIGLEKIAG